MLTGMPSTVMARSVPWSRLKPRRKYWLALPSPECWVTISPGTASSNSPTRAAGRALNSSPLMMVSLAEVGCRPGGPDVAEPEVTPVVAASRLARLDDRGISRALLAARLLRLPDPPLPRRFRRHHRNRRKLACPGFRSGRLCIRRSGQDSDGCARQKQAAWKSYATPMPPHDNCYNRPATAPVRPNPALKLSFQGMTLQ